MRIPLNFKTSCCNLKITGLGKKTCEDFFNLALIFEIFLSKQRFPSVFLRFSCEKTLLNITHDRKGNSEFPHPVFYYFMIEVRLSLIQKMLIILKEISKFLITVL